jgi:DNA invertase Pin-like site-specific DNA recombinase
MAKEYKVGIYVRLSNEDSRAGESVSVENQKFMLLKHVKEMGWELTEIYQDDGFSGTNQNRPAFQRMMADVKQGHVNTILIKDAYVKHILNFLPNVWNIFRLTKQVPIRVCLH